MWRAILEIEHLSEYLSLGGIVLSLIGFSATLVAVFRAKSTAEAARLAADQARGQVRKLDLISEMATVLRLAEELKRLHRSNAYDILPDRYSDLRLKVMVIRESKLFTDQEDQSLLQDVVVRLSALEQALDKSADVFQDKKRLARSNESLSNCMESIVRLNERIKNRTGLTP